MKNSFSSPRTGIPAITGKISRTTTSRKRRSGASKPPSRPPAWAWLVAGVAIGLLLAFLHQLITGPKPGNVTGKTDTSAGKQGAIAKPKTAGDKEEFTFFTVLPDNEVVVVDPPTPAASGDATEPDFVYFLQAGSFPSLEQADARRAQIAFLGQETTTENVTVNGQTLHRVMIGPISRTQQQSIRDKLMADGIESLAYKRAKP